MKPAASFALALCLTSLTSCDQTTPSTPAGNPPALNQSVAPPSIEKQETSVKAEVAKLIPPKVETPPPMPDKPVSPAEKFKDQIAKLTPVQRHVTQESGTERAFTGEYWNNHEPGIYVDIVSNKPLFSSLDKFDSGCGWPSFAKTLAKDEVKELSDNTHGMQRTEVRSSTANSHLGHVFDDGPPELGGLRYCINSASIRFIHLNDLDKEGFGEYKKVFEKKEEAKP